MESVYVFLAFLWTLGDEKLDEFKGKHNDPHGQPGILIPLDVALARSSDRYGKFDWWRTRG